MGQNFRNLLSPLSPGPLRPQHSVLNRVRVVDIYFHHFEPGILQVAVTLFR